MEHRNDTQNSDYAVESTVEAQQLAERKLNRDSNHRNIIGQLDVMIKFVRQGPGRDLTAHLEFLLDAMLEHIETENKFMAVTCYPNATTHRLHHLHICINTADLRCRFSKGLEVFSEELSNIRLLWLIHIQTHDRELENFCQPHCDT